MKIIAYDTRGDETAFFIHMEKDAGIEIIRTEEPLNEDTVQLAKGCEGVTILGSRLDVKVLQRLKALDIHFIATRTIGYDQVDMKAAQELGIKVSHASYGPDGVADYTIMLILMSLRKYKQAMFRGNINDYSLNGLQGKEMKDLTIGIVGTGRIGARVIKSLSGFGCKIIAFDTLQSSDLDGKTSYLPLDELYAQADVVSLHVPLLDSTVQMINKDSLSKMKDGVILINCSRGELMNIPDITNGIETEKIGALALDVFENEEGIYHVDRRMEIIKNREMAYLRQFPNVIMTQHIAFYTDAAVKSMVACGVNSLVSFIKTGRADHEIIL